VNVLDHGRFMWEEGDVEWPTAEQAYILMVLREEFEENLVRPEPGWVAVDGRALPSLNECMGGWLRPTNASSG
jgi:hypothetical protein